MTRFSDHILESRSSMQRFRPWEFCKTSLALYEAPLKRFGSSILHVLGPTSAICDLIRQFETRRLCARQTPVTAVTSHGSRAAKRDWTRQLMAAGQTSIFDALLAAFDTARA